MAKRNLFLGGAVPMEPGERDKLVIIQTLTESAGGSGFPVEDWELLATIPMRKEDLKGNERFQAAQLSAPFTTRWEMGYRDDMDPELVDVTKKRRLSYRGRIHDIVEGQMIGHREGIELMTLAHP